MKTVLDRNLIRTIMEDSYTTQEQLALKMGYEDQSAISQLVNRKRCSLDKAIAALEKMGYSLVVKRNGAELYEVKTEWSVDKKRSLPDRPGP